MGGVGDGDGFVMFSSFGGIVVWCLGVGSGEGYVCVGGCICFFCSCGVEGRFYGKEVG